MCFSNAASRLRTPSSAGDRFELVTRPSTSAEPVLGLGEPLAQLVERRAQRDDLVVHATRCRPPREAGLDAVEAGW